MFSFVNVAKYFIKNFTKITTDNNIKYLLFDYHFMKKNRNLTVDGTHFNSKYYEYFSHFL
jgi:hypothetical protein